MNILITNVSKVRLIEGRPKIDNYIDERENDFEGCMTNEAPIKSIIKRLQLDNQNLDRILYIESDTVRRRDENIKNLTHADFLRILINRYCDNNGYKPAEYDEVLDSIRISDEPNAEEVSESVFKVYNRIVQLSQQNDEVNIYIEANGGVRYVLSMLLSITKSLESRLDNVHIKEISSMVFNAKSSKEQDKRITCIRNTKSIFDTTQIVGIIDEFVNYGKVNSLKKYVEALFQDIEDNEMISDVDNIIVKLSQLSDDIQLCRTFKMLDDFYLDGGIGAAIQVFCDKYKENKDSEIVIFKYLLKEIYLEYKEVIYDGFENYEETILNLPKIIDWCVKKDFIQQAITLCSESIPQYLFASGKIELSKEYKIMVKSIPTKHYEECYYFISHMSKEFIPMLDAPKQNLICKKIQEIDSGKYLNANDEKWKVVFKDTELICQDDKVYSLCAVRVYKIVEYFMKLKNITENTIINMFKAYNIDSSIVNKKVKVSNNYSSTVLDALIGKCYSSKKGDNYDILKMKSKRIIVVLPQLIKCLIVDPVDEKEYDNVIDEVFSGESIDLADALKKKFSKNQSDKFYIKEVLKTGHVKTNIDAAKLQRILYLYSLCKEQRNLSNHAYVSEADREVAMNSYQISILIRSMIELC